MSITSSSGAKPARGLAAGSVSRLEEFLAGYAAACNRTSSPPEPTKLKVAALQSLLDTFHTLLARENRVDGHRASRFHQLLQGFRIGDEAVKERASVRAARNRRHFENILLGYGQALAEWEKGQAERAERFDALECLGVARSEIHHSRVLAWLLDPNMRRHGTHAQGNLGFRLLLAALRLPDTLAEKPYRVRREVAGDESRIDVEVSSRGEFIIHIEVKIGAAEGTDQTTREWNDLQRAADLLGIPESIREQRVFGLFLTPDGTSPGCPKFRAISWRAVAGILKAFASRAQPSDVRFFAEHYARSLERSVISGRLNVME